MKTILQILALINFIIALIYTTTVERGREMIEYQYIVNETEILTDTLHPELFKAVFRPFECEIDDTLRYNRDIEKIRLAMYNHPIQNVRAITTGGQSREHITLILTGIIAIGILFAMLSLTTHVWSIQAD